MADAMDLLTGLLKNKDALNGLKNMMSNNDENEQNLNENIPSYGNDMPDLSFLGDLLSGNRQNVEIMNKIKSAYDAYSDESDHGVNLLKALKPYLSSKRTENLSKIMTAVKVGKAFNKFGR